MEEYIGAALKAAIIWPSSPAGAGFCFVGKKDKTIRPCAMLIIIRAVQEWPTPTSRREVQRFLVFANFYRKFFRNFSRIASPLHALTSSKVQFLSPERTAAF